MSDLITMGKAAKKSATFLAQADTLLKNNALKQMSAALIAHDATIIKANEQDLNAAKNNGVTEVMLDRLKLDKNRIQAMAQGLLDVAELPDPIGHVSEMWKNDANLTIGKQQVPLGVIGIIYESRPNVTADAAALCFKSGNAVILRGGKEAIHSNRAIVLILQTALEQAGFPKDAIQLITDTSRETARQLMQLNRYLDVLIPRGGATLIQTVLEHATVPVIETGTGNCHVYIDESADLKMATDIIVNAKCSRPSVCNSAETLLIHRNVAYTFLPVIEEALAPYQVELRADSSALAIFKTAVEATEEDWETEFLDFILAVKVVDSIDEAIQHINQYSTKHSESIVTSNYFNGQQFHREVDSAAVYINASTRFTDGFEFGFGAEIGISTQKLHARGPMGLNELTSSKYIIFGEGQIR
ncbi:glutamate-5-semialdehyde dehydrogenase [Carnobacterium divergens]|uniref:glutamate-5-semialdehyde dehydrogenase n=1 Tax=Carnobacterium divergens TaxID=2748 RepID=UPI000D48BDEC|nr:glutamate-5-semialdehyde dehydrogenase [Carnobacterium divergens]MCO6018687.1 glutamate-5-semialdehyde dehydrogenase [Carnobacterium divergens]TFI63987.1 glutamate-5-semialdehyde dehydrogenase [Carnobacterium divergens]TFI91150.1 glutamate-5-semialdehyde dehydrogenase [Carnobacterium divergens]TFJ06017.1 glutamate-5-semialdehyde dehydrogenase [Carnobacterium divergens]TFJ07665.1 glutamate-5-semialdehyde dehydrogenase [Carnobacterium divergens]